MKNLLLIFTLLFSTLMFSSPSYAKWTKSGISTSGNTYYVDFERITKHGGYVYWWELIDYLKPSQSGNLSTKVFHQGGCKLFRLKTLSYSFHKEPMGSGDGETFTPPEKWTYPVPISADETILKSVCSR